MFDDMIEEEEINEWPSTHLLMLLDTRFSLCFIALARKDNAVRAAVCRNST
jgi:hypothetical protein